MRWCGGLRARTDPGPPVPVYVLCGVAMLYSLMFTLAATSVWLGRNETLYDFWFYITNFSRLSHENLQRPVWHAAAAVLQLRIPVLVVVNVPARLLVRPLNPRSAEDWSCRCSLFLPRWPACGVAMGFQRALVSYRSASS